MNKTKNVIVLLLCAALCWYPIANAAAADLAGDAAATTTATETAESSDSQDTADDSSAQESPDSDADAGDSADENNENENDDDTAPSMDNAPEPQEPTTENNGTVDTDGATDERTEHGTDENDNATDDSTAPSAEQPTPAADLLTNLEPAEPTYLITIPDEWDTTVDEVAVISAEVAQLPASQALQLTVASANNFHLTLAEAPEQKLPYTLLVDGQPLGANAVVATFTADTERQTNLSITQGWEHIPYAGTYSDRLTFTIEFVEN